MAGYSRRVWTCPFYIWDERRKIHCEGGAVETRSREALSAYAVRFCGSVEGWEECPIARELVRRYDEQEKAKQQNRKKP